MSDEKKKKHPGVPYLQDQLGQGKMSRREFVRYACLLGTSFAAANAMATVAAPAALASGAQKPTFAPVPQAQEKPAWEQIQRGGTLRVASQVQKVTHPAQFSWVSPTN